MFVSIRKYHGMDDADEIGIRLHASDFLHRLRSLPGFRGYYAVDCGDGVGVSISLYDTLEAVEASNRLAAEWAQAECGSLLPNPPEIISGEIVAMTLPQPPARPDIL